MPGWTELSPFVALALVGAAHCAGMCGGFAIAVSAAAGRARRRVLARELWYVLGKALTYAVLGLLAARAGELFGLGGAALAGERGAPAVAFARRVAAVAAGAGLVAVGLSMLLRRSPVGAPLGGRLAAPFRRAAAAVRQLPGALGAFGTGLLTGLLPCGLSLAALILAAGAGPAAGALGMFLFGLGTGPVLVALGLGWSGVGPRVRRVGARAAGPLLVALGLFTGLRGLPPGSESAAAAVLPDCCTDAPEGG